MRHKEVKQLVEELEGKDIDGPDAEPILKKLVVGAFVNLARIADTLEAQKPARR